MKAASRSVAHASSAQIPKGRSAVYRRLLFCPERMRKKKSHDKETRFETAPTEAGTARSGRAAPGRPVQHVQRRDGIRTRSENQARTGGQWIRGDGHDEHYRRYFNGDQRAAEVARQKGVTSVMALLVKSDGTIAVTLPHDGSEFTLKELQTFVGGHIEVMKISGGIAGYEGEFEMMVCNERARLDGLPTNMIATALYV